MQVCRRQTCSEQKTELYLQNQFSVFAVGGDTIMSFSVISLPDKSLCAYPARFNFDEKCLHYPQFGFRIN